MKNLHDHIACLIKDDAYLKLVKRLNDNKKFNVFNVLGHADYEIRHSNIIGWLLDPKGNHGLEDRFIKDFIELLKITYDYDIKINTNNVHVIRERIFNIDIVIKSENPNSIIAIENKVWSQEGHEQLLTYRRQLEKNYGKDKSESDKFSLYYIYLTQTGSLPSSDTENWIQIKHKDIYDIIRVIMGDDVIDDPNVHQFLKMYIDMLEDKVLGNPDTNKIISDVAYEHKDLLDKLSEEKNWEKSKALLLSITDDDIEKHEDAIARLIGFHKNIHGILKDHAWDILVNRNIDRFRRMSSIGFCTNGLASIRKKFIPSLEGYLLYYIIINPNSAVIQMSLYPYNNVVRDQWLKLKQWILKHKFKADYEPKSEYGYLIFYEDVFLSSKEYAGNNVDMLKEIVRKKLITFLDKTSLELEKYIEGYFDS